jgi:hypothetical protein
MPSSITVARRAAKISPSPDGRPLRRATPIAHSSPQNPHPTPLRGATFSHKWEKERARRFPLSRGQAITSRLRAGRNARVRGPSLRGGEADAAIQSRPSPPGLLRFARNDSPIDSQRTKNKRFPCPTKLPVPPPPASIRRM